MVIFRETRFAKCKGWAGFSRVPVSWEEEGGFGVIFCSVLVCVAAAFSGIIPQDDVHVAFLVYTGIYKPFTCLSFFSFILVLLALSSVILLYPDSIFGGWCFSGGLWSLCASLPVLPAPLLAYSSSVMRM